MLAVQDACLTALIICLAWSSVPACFLSALLLPEGLCLSASDAATRLDARTYLHGEPFNPDKIWKSALHRYARNAHALEYRARLEVNRAEARNSSQPAPLKHLQKAAYPFATIDSSGTLRWTKKIQLEFSRYEVEINREDSRTAPRLAL